MANDTRERDFCGQGVGFWRKCAPLAKRAGRWALEKALCLYYAAKAKGTPKWAKSAIVGAVLYNISPVDLIPDTLPIYGRMDNLGAVLVAVAAISSHITKKIKADAAKRVRVWLG